MKQKIFYDERFIGYIGILRSKDRITRIIRQEQDRVIRNAVQFKSASGFLAEIEEKNNGR